MVKKKSKKNVETNEEPEVVVVEKSNRSLYVVIMLLVFGLGLCLGYIITSGLGVDTLNNPRTESPSTNATESTSETKSLIKESGKELIYVEDGVPVFNINSSDAEKANTEIKSFLGQTSDGCGYSYVTYQYKNVLTIVTTTYCDGGGKRYNPYVIDSKTGKLLTNEEMLKEVDSNITSATLVDSLVEAYKGTNDATELESYYKENHNKNLSDLYSSTINKYKMFINSNGEIVVITKLIPSAGPSINSFAFNINKKTLEEIKSQ